MNQGFTPDRASFERILCAAFMIQQMNGPVFGNPSREIEKTLELSEPAHILPAPESFDLEAVLNQAELALAQHANHTLPPGLIQQLHVTEPDADTPVSEFSASGSVTCNCCINPGGRVWLACCASASSAWFRT